MSIMKEQRIVIKKYPIRLGQFLKLAEITSDGIEAKQLITSNKVLVNNIIDSRRGRQLIQGDLVVVDGNSYLCI